MAFIYSSISLGGGVYLHLGFNPVLAPPVLTDLNIKKNNIYSQRGRGHWAVYYTSPQSFITTFLYLLTQQFCGLLRNFYWLVNLVECLNDLTTNFNLQKGYFCKIVIGGCTSIYRPLSYHFRSLTFSFSREATNYIIRNVYPIEKGESSALLANVMFKKKL